MLQSGSENWDATVGFNHVNQIPFTSLTVKVKFLEQIAMGELNRISVELDKKKT